MENPDCFRQVNNDHLSSKKDFLIFSILTISLVQTAGMIQATSVNQWSSRDWPYRAVAQIPFQLLSMYTYSIYLNASNFKRVWQQGRRNNTRRIIHYKRHGVSSTGQASSLPQLQSWSECINFNDQPSVAWIFPPVAFQCWGSQLRFTIRTATDKYSNTIRQQATTAMPCVKSIWPNPTEMHFYFYFTCSTR